MSRTLVAYYSWTGHTRQVAEAIADALGADIEQIREVCPREGWIAYFRSAWEVLRGRMAPIEPPEKDPSGYDLVVIGTPVWAGRVSSPMRAYIAQLSSRFARTALFCSQGSASGDEALNQAAELCGKAPVATLSVSERELRSGTFRGKVADFVKALQ